MKRDRYRKSTGAKLGAVFAAAMGGFLTLGSAGCSAGYEAGPGIHSDEVGCGLEGKSTDLERYNSLIGPRVNAYADHSNIPLPPEKRPCFVEYDDQGRKEGFFSEEEKGSGLLVFDPGINVTLKGVASDGAYTGIEEHCPSNTNALVFTCFPGSLYRLIEREPDPSTPKIVPMSVSCTGGNTTNENVVKVTCAWLP